MTGGQIIGKGLHPVALSFARFRFREIFGRYHLFLYAPNQS